MNCKMCGSILTKDQAKSYRSRNKRALRENRLLHGPFCCMDCQKSWIVSEHTKDIENIFQGADLDIDYVLACKLYDFIYMLEQVPYGLATRIIHGLERCDVQTWDQLHKLSIGRYKKARDVGSKCAVVVAQLKKFIAPHFIAPVTVPVPVPVSAGFTKVRLMVDGEVVLAFVPPGGRVRTLSLEFYQE